MSWRMTPLRERLLKAIGNAKAPILLLQANNDYSTGPVEVLGPAVERRGPPNQAKLYPAFGPAATTGSGTRASRVGTSGPKFGERMSWRSSAPYFRRGRRATGSSGPAVSARTRTAISPHRRGPAASQ
jgi:hypothetical protein